MRSHLHKMAGAFALLMVAAFWLSTLIAEAFLSTDAIVAVKRAILLGMGVLTPLLVLAGASGALLAKRCPSALAARKQRRMRWVALNGLLVLAPCAFFLAGRAAAGGFDPLFYGAQGLELVAGALQLSLLAANLRDGLALRAATA